MRKILLWLLCVFSAANCFAKEVQCNQFADESKKLQAWITIALNNSSSIGCPNISETSPIYKLESIAKKDSQCSGEAQALLLAFYSLFKTNPNYKMCGFEIKFASILAESAVDGDICKNLKPNELNSCFVNAMVQYSKLKENGDLNSAFILAKKTADSNDVTGYSQMYLGFMYYFGEGTNKDVYQSIKWNKIALEKIDSTDLKINILTLLSISYEDYHDYKKAIYFARQCASMGDFSCKVGVNRISKEMKK